MISSKVRSEAPLQAIAYICGHKRCLLPTSTLARTLALGSCVEGAARWPPRGGASLVIVALREHAQAEPCPGDPPIGPRRSFAARLQSSRLLKNSISATDSH